MHTVKIERRLSGYELGRVFTEADSFEQSLFLIGMASAYSDLEAKHDFGDWANQCGSIALSLNWDRVDKGVSKHRVIDMLEVLIEHLKQYKEQNQ